MNASSFLTLLVLSCCYPLESLLSSDEPPEVDVLQYQVFLEPNFADQSISGHVRITYQIALEAESVSFDSGDLLVTKAKGDHIMGFRQEGKQTIISLSPDAPPLQEIELWYQGKPKRGLVFPKEQQLYSLYFTSDWMVCNFSPVDRAKLELTLLLPEGLTCVASGELQESATQEDHIRYVWRQDYETPAYTYGFAIGAFESWEIMQDRTKMVFYTDHYCPEDIETIFQTSGEMLDFFEEISGIPYPQSSYSQVLIGDHYQEMSGFAVLKHSYGYHLLLDSTETHLLSHELAHQWWGNRITCRNWQHFWLNEGFATFMSAAFNERHFGAAQYQKDIAAYRGVYEAIQAKGADKPLVFPNWNNPSRDDRNLVYFKGAYVLHLLRKEMGEEAFWQGIKEYSQTYLGQSVTTADFQKAMEQAADRSLVPFFERWVYE
ncbi:MAG: M1 family aminopeptidase [Bacteroidota bacterium]